MIKNELAPGIVVYSNVLDQTTPLHIQLETAMKSVGIPWEDAYVQSEGQSKVDKTSRDTLTFVLRYSDTPLDKFDTPKQSFFSSLSNLLLQKFMPVEDDYKRMFATDSQTHEPYAFLKYGVGQNFINHVDDYQNRRKISTVYYSNDDYTGGEIVFPRFGLTYKPKADEMILFPSTYTYNHSVLPVESGTRYAIVSWLA